MEEGEGEEGGEREGESEGRVEGGDGGDRGERMDTTSGGLASAKWMIGIWWWVCEFTYLLRIQSE